MEQLVHSSLMLVTALVPHIGYKRCAQIVAFAEKHHQSLRQAALALGIVDALQFDTWVDASAMV